jgi:tRNA(Ile2) C34 agmatinyltransferase TiaS
VFFAKYAIQKENLEKAMAPAILSCNACGSALRVLGKQGAYLITQCPRCGMSSQPQLAQHLSDIERRSHSDVEVVRVDKRRHRAVTESEPPGL